MATNAGPIYGKQFIRYAETWEATVDVDPASPVALAAGGAFQGLAEVGELRAVAYFPTTPAAPNLAAQPDALAAFTGPIVGVNQAYVPTALAQPYTARQMTVATSGLLLVEGVNEFGVTWTAPALNTQLRVDLQGRAVAAPSGTAASIDGTTPLIREIISIGGRNMVLVSFA